MKNIALPILLSWTALSCAGAGIVLTPRNAEIVVPDASSKTLAFAAGELQRTLGRTFGADIPVSTSPSAGSQSIVLGDNALAREAGIRVETLPRDAFRIVADEASGRIYIAGRDDPGDDVAAKLAKGGKADFKSHHATLFGVYEFLERFAGVRFYFPGELGTCVPRMDRIVVPPADVYSEPVFKARHYYVAGDGAWPEECDADYGGRLSGKNLCWLRLRMQTKRITPCHGQNSFHYTERFRDTHPEYLQLRKNGKRATELMPPGAKNPWYYGHWCHTSPIWDVFYEDVVRRMRSGEKYMDVTPQDGLQRCWCERCQAAYSKEHPGTWATELMWGNVVRMANRLIADKVDGYLLMSAYGAFSRLPDFDIPTNVIVDVSEKGPWMKAHPDIDAMQHAHYLSWHRKTGAKNIFWNYACKWSGFDIPDVPQSTPRAVGEFYERIAPISLGGFYESGSDRALYNYLNYYVFSRVCWNGKVDVDALLAEHHRLMFGAAAAPMGEFFDSVEERWIYGVAGRPNCIGMNSLGPVFIGPSKLELWTSIYTADLVRRWEGLFDRAAAAVPPGSLEGRRISFLRGIFLEPLAKARRDYMETASVERELRRRGAGRNGGLVENGGFASAEKWECRGQGGEAVFDGGEGVVAPGSMHLVATDHSPTGAFLRAYATHRLAGGSLRPGATYRLSFFMKVKDVCAFGQFCGADVVVHYAGGDHSWPSPAVCGSSYWSHQEYVFTVPADASPDEKCWVRPRIINSRGEAWFDDFLLEEVKRQ